MITNIKSGYAFARNPIILRNTDINPDPDYFVAGVPYYLRYGGEVRPFYTGLFTPPLNVNISEILDAVVEYFPEPRAGLPADLPIIEIQDNAELQVDRGLFVSIGDDFDEWECIVIPGGISKQNYKQLNGQGTDVFNARFLNKACNYFLTTRTASWRIIMKETELYPLYFINPDDYLYITIVERVTGRSYVSEAEYERGVFALDVDRARRYFFDNFGVLANVLDIYTGEHPVFSCRIVVERSDTARERYRLKFRNSLGVFEVVEIAGELSIAPAFDQEGETVYDTYDPRTDDFTSARERIPREQVISVKTGVKRPDEVRHLMDMIASDEVYILDLADLPVKVIPSVEDFTYRGRPEAPEAFTLKLSIADKESNIMQDIIDGSEGRKPRVFSKEFSKQFN